MMETAYINCKASLFLLSCLIFAALTGIIGWALISDLHLFSLVGFATGMIFLFFAWITYIISRELIWRLTHCDWVSVILNDAGITLQHPPFRSQTISWLDVSHVTEEDGYDLSGIAVHFKYPIPKPFNHTLFSTKPLIWIIRSRPQLRYFINTSFLAISNKQFVELAQRFHRHYHLAK